MLQFGLRLIRAQESMPKTFSAFVIAAAFVLVALASNAQGQVKGSPPLPESKGKQLVEGMCSGCPALIGDSQ